MCTYIYVCVCVCVCAAWVRLEGVGCKLGKCVGFWVIKHSEAPPSPLPPSPPLPFQYSTVILF